MTDKYVEQAKNAYAQLNMSHDRLSRLIDSLSCQDAETQGLFSIEELRNVRSIIKSARLRLGEMLPVEPMVVPVNTNESYRMIQGIRNTLDAAGISWLSVEQDETGISLRHDTGDNTSKENYDNALNDVGEIRAALLSINYGVEIEMADHDTVIYKLNIMETT